VWYLLRGIFSAEARVMLRMGLYLAAVLVPAQLVFGHLNGEYVVHRQPEKMAAIEARWHDEKPASEVLIAWPDVDNHRNLFAITLPPPFGSLIDSDDPSAGEVGLESIPPENWPPVVIPFFSFRIMVGCWAVMLLIAWIGSYLIHKGRAEQNRLLLWAAFLSFPLPYIAILTGWITAEVGRQPWVGLRRVADRRRDDAISDRAHGGDLARRLLRRLQLHLRVRNLLHLSAAARRTGRAPGSASSRRSSQPPDVGR
jgi:cytochrome d ubiquinol oxidase subunit I